MSATTDLTTDLSVTTASVSAMTEGPEGSPADGPDVPGVGSLD